MEMVGKPLPFSLDSTASLISLSEPQQLPKTLISVMLRSCSELTFSQRQDQQVENHLWTSCVQDTPGWGFSCPIALLPSPSH